MRPTAALLGGLVLGAVAGLAGLAFTPVGGGSIDSAAPKTVATNGDTRKVAVTPKGAARPVAAPSAAAKPGLGSPTAAAATQPKSSYGVVNRGAASAAPASSASAPRAASGASDWQVAPAASAPAAPELVAAAPEGGKAPKPGHGTNPIERGISDFKIGLDTQKTVKLAGPGLRPGASQGSMRTLGRR